MKIGILKTDSVLPQFQPDFGDYPEMFRRLLTMGGEGLSFETFDVEAMQYPADLDDCDGYVITGSKKSVYDDEPWIHRLADYVRELHAAKKKTVGICFGHQMVAFALDGEAGPAEQGWGVGVHSSPVFEDAPWMRPRLETLNLIVSHKDQVSALPTDSTLLAGNEFCRFGMFTVGNHILCIQGHPEFVKPYSATLIDYRQEIIGQAAYEQGLASLARETHEEIVARWIVNFIAEGSAQSEEAV